MNLTEIIEKVVIDSIRQKLTETQADNLSESQIRIMAELAAGDSVTNVMINKVRRAVRNKIKIADREHLTKEIETQLSTMLDIMLLSEITHQEVGGKPVIEIWPVGKPLTQEME